MAFVVLEKPGYHGHLGFISSHKMKATRVPGRFNAAVRGELQVLEPHKVLVGDAGLRVVTTWCRCTSRCHGRSLPGGARGTGRRGPLNAQAAMSDGALAHSVVLGELHELEPREILVGYAVLRAATPWSECIEQRHLVAAPGLKKN